MNERVMQFRVGVMVLAAILITGILVLFFNNVPSLVTGSYDVHVVFPQAPGVAKDTPVRRSGILIGRVTNVRFTENDEVLVTLEIEGDRAVRKDDDVRVTTSLLGDSQIEVIRKSNPYVQASDSNPQSRTTAKPSISPQVDPGATIQGSVAENPLQTFAELKGDFSRTADSLTKAGNEVGKLANNLNKVFEGNDKGFDQLFKQTETTLATFEKTLKNIDDVIGDPQVKANLKQSMVELPKLLADAQQAINGINQAMRTVDSNLQNIEGLTKPLGERGPQIVANMDSSVARLNDLLAQVEQFSRALNSKEGSLGQLINNPDVYQQLNQAAENINELTKRLRPIVEDARVFADKIARHPGVILTDAVKPGSGTKFVTPETGPQIPERHFQRR
ncbi:MAG: MlaD family protein [Planctomycetota bacterium]|nr:MlaD family protein [Planctomycetota bacterium]